MRIVKDAIAGTLESSDAMVRVSPGGDLDVSITSSVEAQFGDAIKDLVDATLADLGVAEGKVIVEDKGALDCTLKARVTAAVSRGSEESVDWSTL